MFKGQERSIPLVVILSIVTCGIYNIYWLFKLTEEMQEISGEKNMNPAVEVLLCFVTCGIYYVYWNYKYGKILMTCQEKYGFNPIDNSTLFLILGFFQLSLVSQILMQIELNKFWEQK